MHTFYQVYIILGRWRLVVRWLTTACRSACNDPFPSFWIRHLHSFPLRNFQFPPSPLLSSTDTGNNFTSCHVLTNMTFRPAWTRFLILILDAEFFFIVFLIVKVSFLLEVILTGLDRFKHWFEYLTKCLRKKTYGGFIKKRRSKIDERHLVESC